MPDPNSSAPADKDVILVVDDDLAVLDIMREILTTMGCEAVLAPTLAQARQVVQQNPSLTAILCDQRLTDGLGLEFFRELKESHPGPIRVLITGHLDAEAALAAINQNDIFRFLPKPCSIDDVKIIVNQALDRRRSTLGKEKPLSAARLAAEQAQPLKGTVLGDYEVGDLLGRGGMAIVYRGRQISLDRPVAIKVLPPELCSDHEYVDRFLREARAAAHLNHPNIIQIYDAGVSGNIYFFVMEFVDGKNMGQIVREQGRLAEPDALRVVQYTAMGLAFAHSRGIVHRDVKPENIMRTGHGAVKIGDLGLVKWKPNEYDHSLTVSGNTMGTPFYISPEQIRGLKDIDGRADVYSLGMTLYHFLAGRPAFCQGTAAEIMAQHLSDELPPLQELNPEVSHGALELVSLMTTKRREDRISDMGMVSLLITDILGEPASTTTPVAAMPRPMVPPREEPVNKIATRVLFVIGAVIMGLILALLVIVAWKVTQRRKPSAVGPVSTNGVSVVAPLPAPKPAPVSRPAPAPKPAPAPAPAPKPAPKPQPPATSATVPAPAAPSATPAPTPAPAPAATNAEHKVAPTPAAVPEEVREFVIDRTSHSILEITISSFPRVLDAMAQRGAGATTGGDQHGESELMDLVVGRSERGEFRSLVRVDWDEKQWQKLLQNASRCTGAYLEITPVFYSGKQTDYVEVEVSRVLKPWGNNPTVKLFLDPVRYFSTLAEDTNWEWASRAMKARWDRKGADSSVFDFEKSPLGVIDDPTETSVRISPQELGRPVRFGLLDELRRLADESVRGGKAVAHYGWLIRPVRGTGELRLHSALTGGKDGPRLVFSIRCKAGEEPLTSAP